MAGLLVPGRHAVYAAALNRPATLHALGDALSQPPYQAPPRAPVLHLKPANTWSGDGDPIRCPAGVAGLRMGGSVGLVIGRPASRLTAGRALDWVGGLVVVNDVHLPIQSHFRPAIKERCRDGFCPIGTPVPMMAAMAPDRLALIVEINGKVVCREPPEYLRSAAALLAEVSAFLTLGAGDILLLGEPAVPPLAGPGDLVRIIVDGIGTIENPVIG